MAFVIFEKARQRIGCYYDCDGKLLLCQRRSSLYICRIELEIYKCSIKSGYSALPKVIVSLKISCI